MAHTITQIKIEKSWDCLMSIMEQIETEFEAWTCIHAFNVNSDNTPNYNCEIRIKKPNSDGDHIYYNSGDWKTSKIEAVYVAVIDFIEWCNKQKDI